MANLTWAKLSIAFKTLCVACIDGGKSGDGTMKVMFLNDAMYEKPEVCLIRVEFYAYCMPRMARHHEINFNNEEKALQGVRKCLQEEVRFINQSRVEEGYEPIPFPDILKETEEEKKQNEYIFNKYKNFC